MKAGQYIVVVDSSDGPYDSKDAAVFVARDICSRFANGEYGSFKGRKRKALVAKVEEVVEHNPTSWWDRMTGRMTGRGAA